MLLLVGFNHRSAPVSLRERVAFPEPDLPDALQRLVAEPGLSEALIISTCNRSEVLARIDIDVPRGLEAIQRFFREQRNVTAAEIDKHSYHFAARDAVRHLFNVAAGLDSMILGEPQILGQVKQAYRSAQRSGTTGPVIERLLQQCLSTAKRVRTDTGISRHVVSVAYAAVHLAAQIFGDLSGRRALLIGAGKMSDLVARHLTSNGVDGIAVTSRTYSRAVAFAERFQGTALHWEDGLERLVEADIVVTCTGSPEPVLTKSAIAPRIRSRRGRPLFVIDIAVPRDVEPSVNEMDNVYLYDIDGLQGVVDANMEQRRAAAREAQTRIARDVGAFDRWRQTQAITPTIVSLRRQLLGVGRAEFERFRRKLGPLSPEQEEAVEHLTRSVIQKILHRPLLHLRSSVERGTASDCVEDYRRIFGLPDDEPAEPAEGAAEANSDSGDAEGTGPRRLLRGGKDPAS